MSKRKKEGREHLLPALGMSLAHNLCDEGTNRGCVLVCCSIVEAELQKLLYAYFSQTSKVSGGKLKNILDTEGKNPQALLASGWAKATVALLVGLIDGNTYDLYNKIRQLRNDFAHHPGPVKLTQKVVEPMVAMLAPDEKFHVDGLLDDYANGLPLWGYIYSKKWPKARVSFTQTCLLLINRLYDKRIEVDPELRALMEKEQTSTDGIDPQQ